MKFENIENKEQMPQIGRNISYFFILLFIIADIILIRKVNELQAKNIQLEIQKDSILYLQVNLQNTVTQLNKNKIK